MTKKVYIIEGIGDSNPVEYTLRDDETVGEVRTYFANKLGVAKESIEVSTDTKRLTDDYEIAHTAIKKGEVLNIIPRAKGG